METDARLRRIEFQLDNIRMLVCAGLRMTAAFAAVASAYVDDAEAKKLLSDGVAMMLEEVDKLNKLPGKPL